MCIHAKILLYIHVCVSVCACVWVCVLWGVAEIFFKNSLKFLKKKRGGVEDASDKMVSLEFKKKNAFSF